MNDQDASKMLRTYNIAWWGNNYYDVNELGHIDVAQFVNVIIVVAPPGDVVRTQHFARILIVHCNLLHGAECTLFAS